MKNAMKKLLSLALVAMLLVSVVPMGAMATSFQNNYLTFVYKTADGAEVSRYKGQDPLVGEYSDDKITNGAKTFLPAEYEFVNINLSNPEVSGQDVIYTVTVQQKLEKRVAVVIRLNVKDSGTYDYNVGSVKADAAPETMSKQDALIWLNGKAGEYNITSSEATASKSDSEYVFPFAAEKKNSGSTGGSTGGNTLYKYTVTYYDANSNYITQDNKEVAPNTVVDLGNNVRDYKINSGAERVDSKSVKITADGANIEVYTTDNSTVTPPSETKWQYGVTVYDWNGKVIQGTTWYDATPNQNVVIQANNFYQMKVNGVTMGQGVNTFTITKDETQVEVLTTTNSGNKPTDPTTPVASYIDVIVKVDGSTKVNTSVKAQSATVNELLKKTVGDNWASIYKIDYWTQDDSNVKYYNVEGVVNAGQRVTVELIGGTSKHNTNKVMLHVFLNGNTSTVYASYNITGDLAQDYTVSYSEVKSYLMNRYKAKTDAGLDLDGLYYVTGNWVGNYFQDKKATVIEDLDMKLEKGYVHINVMLNNATAKTASNADTSNPKTGDDIYMTVTVMGLSAAALCAVYYISKKRAVR